MEKLAIPSFILNIIALVLLTLFRLNIIKPRSSPKDRMKERIENELNVYCPPKFGPLPKPRLWYNLHDLKGGPDGETKTKKLHP